MVLNILLIYILGYIVSFSIGIGYYLEEEPLGMKKFFWKDYFVHIAVLSLMSWVFLGIIIGELRSKANKK